MTAHINRVSALALLALGAACGGSKTDTPVVTTTGDSAAAVSPSGDAAAKVGTSLVRLVNAVPASSALNVTGDDKAVFDNVAYKDITTYAEVKDNMMDFRLRTVGRDSVIADNKEALMDGNRYTIVAMLDDNGQTKLKVMRDEVVPDAGKTRIRVINTVAGLNDVAVRIQGQKDALFGDIDYGAEAGYKDIDPVTATFEVQFSDNVKPLMIKSKTLDPGKAYTVLLTGKKGKVEAVIFDDAVTASSM